MTSRPIRATHRKVGLARVAAVRLSATLLTLCAAFVTHAEAQLRPLESMDWAAFDEDIGSAFVGVAGFRGHPAALLGSEGRLIELGLVGVSLRSGRIVLSVHGSAYRIFDVVDSFAEPLSTVEHQGVARRGDMGDYRLATAVRLTSGTGPLDAAFRFGVRLPTTDDRVGLERDETDFFTTLGARYSRKTLAVELELGGAISGVASPRPQQTDPIVYAAGITRRSGRLEHFVRVHGHYDTRKNGPPRGNEHLAELNIGLRSLGATWVQTDLVRGLADFSPRWGLEIRLGRSF